MNNKNSEDPKMELCGTRDFTGRVEDVTSPTATCLLLKLSKYLSNKLYNNYTIIQ